MQTLTQSSKYFSKFSKIFNLTNILFKLSTEFQHKTKSNPNVQLKIFMKHIFAPIWSRPKSRPNTIK